MIISILKNCKYLFSRKIRPFNTQARFSNGFDFNFFFDKLRKVFFVKNKNYQTFLDHLRKSLKSFERNKRSFICDFHNKDFFDNFCALETSF